MSTCLVKKAALERVKGDERAAASTDEIYAKLTKEWKAATSNGIESQGGIDR